MNRSGSYRGRTGCPTVTLIPTSFGWTRPVAYGRSSTHWSSLTWIDVPS